MNKVLGSLVLVPMAIAIGATAASAQNRPEGIRAGAFYLQPSLSGGVYYTDNLFKEQGNQADSDVVFNIAPRLIARTARRVHLLQLDVGANADFHAENSADDSIDGHAILTGRYDISRRSSVRAEGGVRLRHDDRGSDLAGNQNAPTDRIEYFGKLSAQTKPNRLLLAVNADIEYQDYDDADANNNDDDRDVTIYGVGARVGYEARKGYTVFVEGRYDIREFSDNIDDVGIRRGSDGYKVRAGLSYRPSPKVTAEFGAGYLSRSFDEPTFNDVDGIDVRADVRWEASRNTDVSFGISRSVAEATDADVAGRLTTRVNLEVVQRIRRAIIAKGFASYTNAKEEGGAGNKDDDTYRAGLNLSYVFHKRVQAGLQYVYERRVSNEADQGHVNNQIGMTFRIGF